MRVAARLVVVALVTASAGWGAPSRAQQRLVPEDAARAAREEAALKPAAIGPAEAMALMRRAVRYLRQAALQREVASRDQERLVLEQARADLDRAVAALSGAQRERGLQLVADLDAAMRRSSEQLGRFDSSFHDPYDPPLPGRNELAVIAKEGQALLREQVLQRPPNTDDVAWTQRGTAATVGSTGPSGASFSPAARGPMPSIPGEEVAWPQLQLRLRR